MQNAQICNVEQVQFMRVLLQETVEHVKDWF